MFFEEFKREANAGRLRSIDRRQRLSTQFNLRYRIRTCECEVNATFPRHIQIHYGRHRREELFEAARRSRACAYLADDEHGPLALQEILLAGCPTVGVRTGASFVRTDESGVVVDRLPPGPRCAESDDDVRALAVFMEAIEEAHAMDRHSVRDLAAREFDSDTIVDGIITAVNKARLGGGIATATSV